MPSHSRFRRYALSPHLPQPHRPLSNHPVTEAPFFPGVLFYLSKWYTKKELNLRMSIFYSGSLISGAFGSLIAAGILSGLEGARGLSSWQWLYIIEGAITVFIGIVITFVLPDFPDTWSLLSPEMKRVANRRMAIEAAEADVDEEGGMSQIKGLKLAMTDPKTYVLAIGYLAIVGAAGFQNFFPTLTATLGYSRIVSLLLCAPPYIFIVFWALAHSLLSDRWENRFWFFMYPIPVTILGWVIFMATDNFGARYFSLFLMCFVFAMNGTCYAWIANAIPRPPPNVLRLTRSSTVLGTVRQFGRRLRIATRMRRTIGRRWGFVLPSRLLRGCVGCGCGGI